MEVYFFTRGNFDHSNRFINDLLAQKYDRDYGKSGTFKIGWQIRPIQLWCAAFPKEYLNEFLATAQPYNNQGIPPAFLWSIRKALKLKSINKIVPDNFKANRMCVQVCGIGIKEDRISDDGYEKV